jgi:hypothetical protein
MYFTVTLKNDTTFEGFTAMIFRLSPGKNILPPISWYLLGGMLTVLLLQRKNGRTLHPEDIRFSTMLVSTNMTPQCHYPEYRNLNYKHC